MEHLFRLYALELREVPWAGTGGPRPQSSAIPQSAGVLTIQGAERHGAGRPKNTQFGGDKYGLAILVLLL
jgi:hypothetical protein